MSRFVFLTIAILRTRFVIITTVTINPLQVNILVIIIVKIIIAIKAEQDRRRGERAERDNYLDMRSE